MTTAESFKRFRKTYGISRFDIAATLGIKAYSYEYESAAKNIIPNGATLIKLAKTYDVSTDQCYKAS